ncbi:MAG: alpha/beta hydrolase [Chloroflexi bacterium]|nr:alpha/beta hydrolase [Chloroflexota bacterium]
MGTATPTSPPATTASPSTPATRACFSRSSTSGTSRWSRGGAIAAKTAADYPARIAQLVLVGAAVPRTVSAPDFPLGHPPESRRARVEHERTDRAGYRWWLVERCVHRPVGELTMRWLWQLSMKMPGWVALTTIEGGLHEDLRPDIPKIKAPTLILHGRHDPLCPIDLGRWTTERLAGSRLVEFAESGHSPFLEEADRFNDELEAFLAEVNGAISRSTGEPASP